MHVPYNVKNWRHRQNRKSEVENILHCRHRRNEPWSQLTFRVWTYLIVEMYEQTDTLIAVLRIPIGLPEDK